jgi:molybdate transport system permease protein
MHWSLWLVLRVAGLATGISVAIGSWLAFLLTSRKLPFDGGWLPMLFKTLLSNALILYWVGTNGPGGAGHWPLTQTCLVFAGVISVGPFFLSAARSAFAGLDPDYLRAARSLGASEWRVFSRIHLRLAFQPILANAAGEFLGVAAQLAIFWWGTGRIFK